MAQFLVTEPKRNRNKKPVSLYPAKIIVRLFDLVKIIIIKKKHLSAYLRFKKSAC